MKKHYIVSLFFALCIQFTYSQAPLIQWQKSFGGSDADSPSKIQKTNDGGYIVVGSSGVDGDFSDLVVGYADFCVVKFSSVGTVEWKKNFGTMGFEYVKDIKQTIDGGYVILASKGADFWIIKLDVIGNTVWQRTMGGSDNDVPGSISQTTDLGYIVCGGTRSNDNDVSGNHSDTYDYWVVKLDVGGAIVWQKALGGFSDDVANEVEQTSDGGYVIAGYTYNSLNGDLVSNSVGNNPGKRDCWIVKLDAASGIVWEKLFGGSDDEIANSIDQTTDGGYIFSGYTKSNDYNVTGNNGNYDAWVVKIDVNANLTWQRALGGGGNEMGGTNSVIQTNDGEFVLLTLANSNQLTGDVTDGYGSDFWVVKLTATGNIRWRKCYGGTLYDDPVNIQQTPDNGFIMVGNSRSNDYDVSGNHGSSDYWIVKLTPETLSNSDFRKNMVKLFPNPVSHYLNIGEMEDIDSIKITDVSGKITSNFGYLDNTIDVSRLANGIYFLSVITKQGSYNEKFIKR